MELSHKEIQQLDSDKIYELLLPSIKSIYNSFSYLNLSEKEYYDIVCKEIEDSKTTYSDDTTYSKFLKKKIKVSLERTVKKLLSNPDRAFQVVNNYIDLNFKKINNLHDAINRFQKLNMLFDKYKFSPDLDLYSKLFDSNDSFRQMTQLMVDEYFVNLKYDKLNNNFNNELFLSIAEAYCIFNNIEFENENIEYNDCGDLPVDDTLKQYLMEIGKIPLLSVEEEKDLAQRAAQGDSKAKEKFIESNLRLVVSVVKRYANKNFEFLDLVQEGNVGLMKALEKFDVTKGYKFSTYATWWIRHSVLSAISNKIDIIRKPVYLHEKLVLFNKNVENLTNKLHRKPTLEEISKKMNISVSEVIELYKLSVQTTSINALVGDGDAEVGDFIPDPDQLTEDIAISELLQEDIRNLLIKCNLKPKELSIITLRNGLIDGKCRTLEEIGQQFGLHRERIRQIEAVALKKIRRSPYIKDFAYYMQNYDIAIDNIDKFRQLYGSKQAYSVHINDVEKLREKEKNEMCKSIYEYFKDYTRKQVDDMISKLSEDDKKLLSLRYGTDLENPVNTKLTKSEIDKFYGSLVPKMKRLLKTPEGEEQKTETKKRGKRAQNIYEFFSDYNKEEVDQMLLKLPDEDKKLVFLRYGEDLHSPSTLTRERHNQFYATVVRRMRNLLEYPNGRPEKRGRKTKTDLSTLDNKPILEEKHEVNEAASYKYDNITKDDYINLLELLKTPMFSKMIKVLPPKASVIVSLKLGFVNGKYFSTESIAQFLEIEEKEVMETTKNALLLYKENINNIIDDIVEISTDTRNKSKVLSIKSDLE